MLVLSESSSEYEVSWGGSCIDEVKAIATASGFLRTCSLKRATMVSSVLVGT